MHSDVWRDSYFHVFSSHLNLGLPQLILSKISAEFFLVQEYVFFRPLLLGFVGFSFWELLPGVFGLAYFYLDQIKDLLRFKLASSELTQPSQLMYYHRLG